MKKSINLVRTRIFNIISLIGWYNLFWMCYVYYKWRIKL